MNPYFTPFTAPDGSTRRPIVERVPECRRLPSGADLCLPVDYENPKSKRPWIWIRSRGDLCDSVEPKNGVALALCRVACEDWLRSEFPCYFPKDENDRETGHFLELDHQYDENDRRLFNGPTIHHALVSAAHAVADAKGIPH